MNPGRINPFGSIYQICNSGNSQDKFNHLAEFPRCIDIELTNICNFKCLMCFTGNGSQMREKGFMSDKVFSRILEEIIPRKTPVRFIRWGEPTLHPKLIDYISEIKKHDILCHINTSGSLLTTDKIRKLIDIGLDSIKFSFQGADAKSYSEMRNIDYYDRLVAIVKLFFEIRGRRKKPFIHVSTTVTYEDARMIQRFKSKLGKITDLVTVGRTVLDRIDLKKTKLGEREVETIRRLKEKESVVKKHPRCPEVFDKLSINWDGAVSACCEDYDNLMIVGDIREQSLKDIWRSEKMNRYRIILARGQHDQLPLCRTCYDYQGLQIDRATKEEHENRTRHNGMP